MKAKAIALLCTSSASAPHLKCSCAEDETFGLGCINRAEFSRFHLPCCLETHRRGSTSLSVVVVRHSFL